MVSGTPACRHSRRNRDPSQRRLQPVGPRHEPGLLIASGAGHRSVAPSGPFLERIAILRRRRRETGHTSGPLRLPGAAAGNPARRASHRAIPPRCLQTCLIRARRRSAVRPAGSTGSDARRHRVQCRAPSRLWAHLHRPTLASAAPPRRRTGSRRPCSTIRSGPLCPICTAFSESRLRYRSSASFHRSRTRRTGYQATKSGDVPQHLYRRADAFPENQARGSRCAVCHRRRRLQTLTSGHPERARMRRSVESVRWGVGSQTASTRSPSCSARPPHAATRTP